jgi:hypothetical protein
MALAGGCSSPSGGEKTFESYSRTRGLLASAQTDVDNTLGALNALRITEPGNLKNAFRQYKDGVARLEKRRAEAKQLAAGMDENMEMNIITWQKEMEDIQDPQVKASVESRREAVQSNYQQVKMYAQDARNAYEPFMRGNQDIIKALSIDLSPANVSNLGPAMDRTAADGKALKAKITAMQQAMENIARGQPPIGNAKP